MSHPDVPLFDPGPAVPPTWKEAMAACRSHGHRTIAEAGACPSCRQHQATMCGDAPYGWLVWYPDTRQVAVVRTWSPDTEDEPTCTAWATGCNTGGTIGFWPVDPATIEASGVETFTLLSGPDADAALVALGEAERPWDRDIVSECPHCDKPIIIGAHRRDPQ